MSETRIDRKLNIVIPVERDGGTIYVHSMPISREVFEANFLVISKTFSALYGQRLNVLAGPRVAALLLRKTAKDMGAWEGPDGAQALMAEILRLTNVVVPTPGGWATLPIHDAQQRGLIDADDVAEAEGAIVFFIVASAMHKKTQVASVLAEAGDLWGTKTSLLNCTEFARSLPISTATENTGVTVAASSVPS